MQRKNGLVFTKSMETSHSLPLWRSKWQALITSSLVNHIHCFFTSFYLHWQHPTNPCLLVLRKYSKVPTHATYLPIHYQASALSRPSKFYQSAPQLGSFSASNSSSIHLIKVLYRAPTDCHAQHTTPTICWADNRPLCLHLFPHIWHSPQTPEQLRMEAPHSFKTLSNTNPATKWHSTGLKSILLPSKPETLRVISTKELL